MFIWLINRGPEGSLESSVMSLVASSESFGYLQLPTWRFVSLIS